MLARSAWSAAFGLILFATVPLRPAAADLDPAFVADTLVGAFGALGATAAYDSAGEEENGVVVRGLRVTLPEFAEATFPSVLVAGAAMRAEGGFTAESITFDNGSATAAGRKLAWGSARLEDVVVPGAGEIALHPKLRPFRALSLANISIVEEATATTIEIADARMEVADVDDLTPSDVSAYLTGVRLPATLIANSVLAMFVGMLNYQEFTADVSLRGAYDPASDTAALETLTVDVATVGKVHLAARATGFSVGGITDPNEEVAQEARSAARLESLSLRIDNAGFVERMLDMQAEMLGGTRDDVRAQIVDGALPFALSFVKNEAFRADFRAAVAAFLADPRSLTIVMQAADPVPLGQVVRTALRAPQGLPDLLAPTVEANN